LGAVFFCLYAPIRAKALDPSKTVFQYNSKSWTYQNGLPVSGINAIAQSKDGYIWLATRSGLVRFDGDQFKKIDIPPLPRLRSSIVKCLSPSAQGGLWFGLYHGAYGYYDGQDAWELNPNPTGGMDWDVPAIQEKGQMLWIGGAWSSRRAITNSTLELLFAADVGSPYVGAILPDSRGRIWLGTTSHGLWRWEQGRLAKIENAFSEERFILSMAEDNEGRIWVGTHLGLCWFDSEMQRHDAAFPGVQIPALLVDEHGVLWIATTGEGVARWKDGVFTSLRKSDGLASDNVLSLAEDREGSLWVGTQEGLTQLADVKLPIYSDYEGVINQSVQAVSASPRGGLWVTSDQGAIYLNKGQVTLYTTNAGLGGNYVKRVLEASTGDVFLISGRNEIEVMADGKVVARHPTAAMPVAMTEDAQGVVVSVGPDLYRVGRDYLTPYAFANGQKPPLYWVLNLITSRDGAIWVACVNGVCRVKDGEYRQWTREDGLIDHFCRWVFEDSEGFIWAGTATGVSRLRGNEIRNIRHQDGLMDGNIWAILADDRDNFWIDSSRGIFEVSRKELNDFADGRATHVKYVPFNGPEATKPFEKYQQEHSGCKTLDGRLWFPASKGVVMIDPANLSANRIPPPVYIRSVRANGIELDQTNNAVVKPGKNDLEFEYEGLSYIAPSKVAYRYKLDGYDKDWVDAGTRRAAFYTNLKPGKYLFQVQACNADGVWNTSGASLAVELQPYYYQTVWFKALLGCVAAAVALGISGWRVGHLRRKQRHLQEARDLLEERVRERTAELAASNLWLTNEIEERKRVQMEVERIHNQLMEASREAGKAEVASSVLHNVGNVLNSVNVSTALIAGRVRNLRLANLNKAADLLKGCGGSLNPADKEEDQRIRHLPGYLEQLARHLGREQEELMIELRSLSDNVEHIKEIVAMQQSYAKVFGMLDAVSLSELVEGALKMHSGAFSRHSVEVRRQYEEVPLVTVDKHKVMQILVNVLHNAKYACDESGRSDKWVEVKIRRDQEYAIVEISDNGVGIAPENLTRIFGHGFTTKRDGHGFGLHSAALAAGEMGGTLEARSEGAGKGATFILKLPLEVKQTSSSKNLREAPAAGRILANGN
jgi:ligand-binding sensor domain-containing protein/signal transduction histidine kinase